MHYQKTVDEHVAVDTTLEDFADQKNPVLL